MSLTWKERQMDRRKDVQAIQQVLDVLNHMNTSVTVQDKKYTIMQNGEKKYEVTIFNHDATIRTFNGEKPEAFCWVLDDGIRAKAKLWLLKFELESATSSEPFEKMATKVKSVKSNIDLINKVLTVLMRDDTRVSIEHETNVMKKYEVLYNMNNQEYRLIVEYNGSLVKFVENGVETTLDVDGYIGWKLGGLRKELDKKMAPRGSFATRLAQKLKNRQYQ